MKVFQVVLVILGIIPIVILRFGFKTSIRAGYRIGFILFIGIFFILSFFPELSQFVAEIVQVGRGADLILYLTAFSFICFVIIVIIKFEKMNQDITVLTRSIAILKSRKNK
jgi:hypothetical protein